MVKDLTDVKKKTACWPRPLRNVTSKVQHLTSLMILLQKCDIVGFCVDRLLLASACKSCPFKTGFAESLPEVLSASRQIATRCLGSKRSTRSTHRTISPHEFIIGTGLVLFAPFSSQSLLFLSMRSKFCNMVFSTEASDIRHCRGRSNRDLGSPS